MPTTPQKYDAVIETPLAAMHLGIVVDDNRLQSIELLSSNDPLRQPASEMAREAASQLKAYFDDPHWQFSLPVVSQGTLFQQRVWQLMLAISVGEVCSYGDAAKSLNSAARAVGGACRRNPVPIVVPCHRIVAANGLGGFNGRREGAEIAFKQWLLNHEKRR